MAHEALQAVVGTAIVDSAFRRSLLGQSAEVVHRFGLSPDEAEIVRSIEADNLADFAYALDCWITSRAKVCLTTVS